MAKVKRIELIQARKRKNKTQSEIAEYLGINQTTYSRLENGYLKLDLERAKKLSNLLKIKISVL